MTGKTRRFTNGLAASFRTRHLSSSGARLILLKQLQHCFISFHLLHQKYIFLSESWTLPVPMSLLVRIPIPISQESLTHISGLLMFPLQRSGVASTLCEPRVSSSPCCVSSGPYSFIIKNDGNQEQILSVLITHIHMHARAYAHIHIQIIM